MVSVLLCVYMLYNLTDVYTSSWYFVLQLPCVWVFPPLLYCYIYVCINFFVNVIYMDTLIYVCTSYDLLLCCSTYWEYFHSYCLYMICYAIFDILVDLHSQLWIHKYFFELVVTCIEAHIFFPSFSISNLFISIIIFFCCFLLLGQLFT